MRESARLRLAAARVRLMHGFLDEMGARLGALRGEAEEAATRVMLGARAEALRRDVEAEARALAVREYMQRRGAVAEDTQRRLAVAKRDGRSVSDAALAGFRTWGPSSSGAGVGGGAAGSRSALFLHYPHDSLGFAESRVSFATVRRGGGGGGYGGDGRGGISGGSSGGGAGGRWWLESGGDTALALRAAADMVMRVPPPPPPPLPYVINSRHGW
jgi:hypothetical protein